jgi:hypothetical protein
VETAETATDHSPQASSRGENQAAVRPNCGKTLVAFQFEKANCVVVGTFNMYILHPPWLAKHDIIKEGTEVGIDTDLIRPGFRFRFPQYKATWMVAPDRLVVESDEPKTDCGKPVAKVLRALPETPLFALGNNVHYKAELSELKNLSEAIRRFPRAESPTRDQSVVQRTFHVGIKRSEHETINLQILLKEDSIELACNVHVELDNREKAGKAVVTAAERFFGDQAEALTLAQHFFGVSIDHGPDNA